MERKGKLEMNQGSIEQTITRLSGAASAAMPGMTATPSRQATTLIDRSRELDEIRRLLNDPACRLLTLLGPGGIGKSRLAAETAQAQVRQTPGFAHGVYWIDLQPVSDAERLPSAIADGMSFTLSGQDDPGYQLARHLRDKELLLVLDNFEHLLEGGSDLLACLLAEAPGLKLLITSREVLNLLEEWLYPVAGLVYPSHANVENLASYGAVQLFVERARRVRPSFDLDAEKQGVVRICRLVEGMPLALELAAAWAKTLTAGVIADEIQRNLEFLSTRLRNVPEQHRSIQAVFAQSWSLLSPREQAVFQMLSVFRGGFDRVAAQAVAEASLPVLMALVDKSLLRREAGDRFQIHELLRQYAEDQLARSQGMAERAQALHCAHYTHFMAQWGEHITGARQREAMQSITVELENFRAAWRWAVAHQDVAAIDQAAYIFNAFVDMQGRYLEGIQLLEPALQMLDKLPQEGHTPCTRADVLTGLGWLYIRLGRFEAAETVFESADRIFEQTKQLPRFGFGADPLIGLALLAVTLGDYREGLRLAEISRRRHDDRGDLQNAQLAYFALENAALALGDLPAARRYVQRAYALTQETENRWMMAYILSDMGNVARVAKDLAQAQHYYQASYAIKQELRDPEGMAMALAAMGRIASLQQEDDQAFDLYTQSLHIYEEIDDRGAQARSLAGLGCASLALGNYEQARHYLARGLDIAAEIQFMPALLCILMAVGKYYRLTGRAARGREMLALVVHHPATDHELRAEVQRLLAEEADKPVEHPAPNELEGMVTRLRAELALPGGGADAPAAAMQPRTIRGQAIHSAELVEQLTAREQEILQLIATGLTNQQIADELILSAGTVKWYTAQIYGKLSVSSRTQALARARELALLA
jgi:predicted ATPase/DNA-binding NarL/FixJ family response regulator